MVQYLVMVKRRVPQPLGTKFCGSNITKECRLTVDYVVDLRLLTVKRWRLEIRGPVKSVTYRMIKHGLKIKYFHRLTPVLLQ